MFSISTRADCSQVHSYSELMFLDRSNILNKRCGIDIRAETARVQVTAVTIGNRDGNLAVEMRRDQV